MVAFIRHSTPTDALRIMYNITPLHLFIRETAMKTYFRVKKYNWLPRNPDMIGHETYIRKMIPKDLVTVQLDKVPHHYAWSKPYTADR